jgi:hypothetical protein
MSAQATATSSKESPDWPSSVPMMRWALSYAKEGRPVFPCRERAEDENNKGPYYRKGTFEHGHLDATTDPKVITDWWIEWPDALIGSPVPDGQMVVDLDPRHGGTIEALTTAFGPIPPTVFVMSGRGDGGCHLFYLRPKGFISASHVKKVCPGVDIKLDTGYTILPPSLHPDTKKPYEWGGPPGHARLPEAFRIVLQHKAPPNSGVGRPNARGLEGILRRMAEEKDSRNDLLYWCSCRLVENRYPDSAFDAITAAAQHAGLSLSEIQKTINSARKALV